MWQRPWRKPRCTRTPSSSSSPTTEATQGPRTGLFEGRRIVYMKGELERFPSSIILGLILNFRQDQLSKYILYIFKGGVQEFQKWGIRGRNSLFLIQCFCSTRNNFLLQYFVDTELSDFLIFLSRNIESRKKSPFSSLFIHIRLQKNVQKIANVRICENCKLFHRRFNFFDWFLPCLCSRK